MARPGDVIDLPSWGVRMRFLQTTAETDGALLRIEVVLPPGFSIAEHVHPRQEEQHEVVSGRLSAKVGGQEREYGPGQRVVGPPGVPHAWHNPSDREALRLVSEHRPVLHMELMLVEGAAIARDWVADKKAIVRCLLRAAVLLNEIKDDFYFTGRRMQIVVWLLLVLAPVGRRLGDDTG